MAEAGGRAPVAILISGRGSNMAALLRAAEAPDCPWRVVLVGANDPDAAGLETARAAGVPTWAHSHKGLNRADYDALVDAAVRAAGAEWIALAGYMRLLSPGFVSAWAGRIVNIHPSLLPLHKGLDTHARAIEAGDVEAGCSVHIVTAELDDGPVIAQARVPVLPGDTPETLAARVLVEEHRLYPKALTELVTR
ncbi:phosphoribosylglycinamide formyltransferase [Sphingomonas jatrophae]|uniref:Phosphoribosylglycinamide formyltransferase n=1 Tax=Sphingomonas jatrophae TaxID=1166337 RepID=A0A1I6L565_9SPHN|nr:phosphoribosylglycinamide formyltransferase-1 [Sphingomonas jatrophae]